MLSRRDWWVFWLLMAASALFRIYLFGSGRLGFESDQAIAGIVALEALHYGDFPLITPGDDYGGQLLSYYLIPLHAVFGANVAAMRLAMIPPALLLAACAFGCAWTLFRSRVWAFTVLALVLFSPSMVCEFFMRPAMLYLIPACAVLIGVAVLVTIMRQAQQGVWTQREVMFGFGAGVLLGLGFWTHPIMLQSMVAMLLFLFCFPRQALFFFGFAAPASGGPDRAQVRFLAAIIQGFLLAALALMTYSLLLFRQAHIAGFARSHCYHLLACLAAASGVALGAQLWLAVKHDRAALLSRFGMVACAMGVWVGALPLIWYLWIDREWLIPMQEFVRWDVFLSQLASVFHTGIPILLGFYHNWKADVGGMPEWLQWTVHGIYWGSLLFAAGAAIHARVAGRRWMEGMWFFLILFGVVLAMFSVSVRGNFVGEPRYLLILYFVFAMAAGCMVSVLRQRGRMPALMAAVLLAVLLAANVWTCLDRPRLPVEPWTGVETSDLQLIAGLKQRGVTRVSCRFAEDGYWHAYKLTYEAREEIVFVPADYPEGRCIRSRRYQRAVDKAPARAYLVASKEAPALEARIRRDGASFRKLCVADYAVFHDLQPDVLDRIPWDKYLAEQRAASRHKE